MKSFSNLNLMLLVVVGIGALSSSASAQTSAFSFPRPQSESTSAAGTDGFEFRPTRNITITALGYYDSGRRGLNVPHRVSLFETDSRRRIAYATIDRRGRRVGRFSYRRIRPRFLIAGVSYTIAGYHSGDNRDRAASNPDALRIAPEIGYQKYRYNYGDAPAFPDQSGGDPFFGPGFQFRRTPSRRF